MNDTLKTSIARKLTLKISVVLAIAFMLLLAVTYFSAKYEVRHDSLRYGKVISAIYADVTAYDAQMQNRPVDISLSDRFTYFGDYMCKWYRIDYLFSFIPDFENDTITYLSVTRSRDKYGDLADDHMTGVKEHHVMTDDEMKAWNNNATYAVGKDGRFGKATEVMIAVCDENGPKAMVGVAVSTDELRHEMMYSFHMIVLLMFIVLLAVAGLMYMLVRKMVSSPARHISGVMADYISGGKRSTIRIEPDESEEFAMMAGAFNHMTEDIDKYIEDIAILNREQERQSAEMDIASQIQRGILRSGAASMSCCGIKAVMKPAKNVGGDLYDYLRLDDSHIMIVVADVSGKGIPSAMLMSIILAHIRQFAKLGYSPAGILKNVNDTFADENPQMMFITAFIGIYDSVAGKLTYANAGHNPPYLIHELPEVLDASNGAPLGLFPDENYEDVEVPMGEGDTVFLYTDGVNEAVNMSREFYGTERLEETLAQAASSSEKDYLGTVEASVHEFVGDAEQNDDITMLVLYARQNPVIELDYDINDFSAISDRLLSSRLPKKLAMDLCVAAEECFVNICSYAFDGPAPEGEKILFSFEYSDKVVMRFSDGGKPFDPRDNLPDTDLYDVDNAVGGLGRLIAFTIADRVDYEYKDGRNILTLTKLKTQ